MTKQTKSQLQAARAAQVAAQVAAVHAAGLPPVPPIAVLDAPRERSPHERQYGAALPDEPYAGFWAEVGPRRWESPPTAALARDALGVSDLVYRGHHVGVFSLGDDDWRRATLRLRALRLRRLVYRSLARPLLRLRLSKEAGGALLDAAIGVAIRAQADERRAAVGILAREEDDAMHRMEDLEEQGLDEEAEVHRVVMEATGQVKAALIARAPR